MVSAFQFGPLTPFFIWITVPPVSAPAGAASFHFDHLQAGLDHHHRHISSAPPTSATAETFGALDLSRRPSMDDEFSGLAVLSYAAMGPTFAAAIDASVIHHHHQAGKEDVHGGEVSTQPHTPSPSPFSEAALLGISTAAAAAVVVPSVSPTSSTLSEDDGPESEDAAGELEIEGLAIGDVRATAKEVAEAVEQEFDDVFA